ncbi:MAG: helix-turn-helix domain-containing protein [Planctomycetota bacterium]
MAPTNIPPASEHDIPADRDEVYLTPEELSRRWSGAVAVKTLTNWRSAGRGPRYTNLGGKPRYPLSAVLLYESKQSGPADLVSDNVRLTPSQLAKRWGCSLRTLANWRSQRKGPSFMRLGVHIVYPLREVQRFEESNLVDTSAPRASEAAAPDESDVRTRSA